MKNHRLSIFLLATLPLLAGGRQLTGPEAMSRAIKAPQYAIAQSAGASKFDADHPAYTASADGINSFYVFNRTDGNGFAIIAADDCVAPVLGYSDEGVFDAQSIPANMQWWLSQYQHEIQYAIANKQPMQTAPYTIYAPVEPLIKTAWDQEAPYNDQCPEAYGSHAVTGCIATAMAQIMKYHEYPAKGQGSNSYNTAFGTQSLDFSQITFDWSQMLDSYTPDSPESNKEAVAKLMHACGVAVNMLYNLDESSASSIDIPSALIDYFNYDKGIQYLKREYYFLNEWEDIIYKELEAGRPVLYDGESGSGGHQFICDGYNEGFYHINWGWGGRSNGYYRLTALEPQNVGAGAAGGEYNFSNNIIIGVKPAEAGSESPTIVYANGDFCPYDGMTYDNPSVVYFTTDAPSDPGFHNGSYVPLTLNMGLKLVDSNGNVTYMQDAHAQTTLGKQSYYPNYAMRMKSIANGTYTVSPAFVTADGIWHDVTIFAYNSGTLKMTVTDKKIEFEKSSYDPEFKIEDFSVDTPIYMDSYFQISAKLTSKKEYSSEISTAMYEVGGTEPVYKTYPMGITIAPGDTIDFKRITIFRLYSPSYGIPREGDYQVQLIDKYGNALSDRIDISYTKAPSTSIEVTDLRLATGDHSPADDIHIIGSLKCTKGYFSGQLLIYLFSEKYTTSLSCFYTPVAIAMEDETIDFDIHGRYLDAKPGEAYYLLARYGNSWISQRVGFTIDKPASSIKILGDANDDNLVTAADAALTVANVIGLNPVNFNSELADTDENGTVGYDDFERTLNLALESEYSYATGETVPEEMGEDFTMEDLYIAPGSTHPFSISLANMTDKRGVQFDLALPEGLTVTDVTLVSEEATPAAYAYLNRTDGVTRIIVVNYQDKDFAEGDQIKVTVKATNDFDCVGRIVLYNALVDAWSDSNIIETRAANASSTIVYDENQNSITDIKATGVSVNVSGRTIIVTSETDSSVVFTDIKGRATVIELRQGVNSIKVPAGGIYFIGNKEVIVK